MKLFKSLAILPLAIAMLPAANAIAGDALARIQQQKTIRVAVPVDYPPYGFVGGDMQPRGLDIDMAKHIADKLAVKLELVPVTAPNRVAYIQTKKADLTISSLGKTAEREKVIDYSIAYAPFFDAVFGAKALQVKNFEEMAGKTVAVTRGSMQDKELDELAPKAVPRRFDDNNGSISAFRSGQTQMVAIGTTVVAAIKHRDPSLDIELKAILSNAPCYIGMGKNEAELRTKINDIIRQAKADGTIDAFSKKWLGAPAGQLPD